MGNLFNHNQQVTVETAKGEVTINLNLNIKVDNSGNLSIKAVEEKESNITLLMPELTVNEMIDFGTDVTNNKEKKNV